MKGGPGRGQGRKPIDKSGELMRSRPVRMTDAQWEKCKRLGGAAWIRAEVEAAPLPECDSVRKTEGSENG